MLECRVEVQAEQLTQAFRALARGESQKDWTEVDFDGAMLSLSMGSLQEKVPAAGSWSGLIHFPARLTKTLAERPIQRSPLEVSVEEGCLNVGNFSVPCQFGPAPEDLDGNTADRVAEALLILKKYRIKKETLAALVAGGDPEYAAMWSGQNEVMLDSIAKAWKVLAPLGVDPREIRRLIHDTVRYGFTLVAKK